MKLKYFLAILLITSLQMICKGAEDSCSTSVQSTIPYTSGESLQYSISFGFYTGARAFMSVSDSIINGIKTFHVKATARTIGVPDYLFKIRDRYETFINPETDLPILSIRDIKEGHYNHYNETTYDRDSAKALSLRTGIHKVPDGVQDMLSIFMFGRKHDFNDDLKPNQLITYRPFFCDTIFTLILRYRGIETIKTKLGRLECYKMSMCEEKNNEVITRDEMSFWVTRDANRIPVKVKFEIMVGSFVVEIEKCDGLKTPLKTRE